MTFIYSFTNNRGTHLLSDSMITWDDKDQKSLSPNNYNNGLLKYKVTSDMVIAYSGFISNALRLFTTDDITISDVYKSHINSYRGNCETDYIVVNKETGAIVWFKDGKRTDTINAWIGNKDAFELFQSKLHNKEKSPSNRKAAFDELILSGDVTGVGGLPITLLVGNGKTRVQASMRQGSGFGKQELKAGVETKVKFYDAEKGSFGLNTADSEKYPFYYIQEGRLGIRYEMENGVGVPKIKKSVSLYRFGEEIKTYDDSASFFWSIGASMQDQIDESHNRYMLGDVKRAIDMVISVYNSCTNSGDKLEKLFLENKIDRIDEVIRANIPVIWMMYIFKALIENGCDKYSYMKTHIERLPSIIHPDNMKIANRLKADSESRIKDLIVVVNNW